MSDMMRKFIMVCALMLSLNSICALAQRSYPKDIFVYPLEPQVTYKGNAPKIGDFVNAFLNQDETSEIMGSLDIAWNHYLRNEPQEPCNQLMVDEKNGYLRLTFDSNLCDDYEDLDDSYYLEMCYWNCDDGKHKIIAENVVSKMDGKYSLGQYSGVTFFIYDNATHSLCTADAEVLGAYIEPVIDEQNCETGEPMTTFDQTIAVYNLPQQGKDIIVEIYQGNKRTVYHLLWDGMYFKRLE